MKQCSKCKLDKPYTDFNWKNKIKGIYQGYCRLCTKQYKDAHYQNNKGYYLEKQRQREIRIWSWVRELKNVPCADCKVKYPYYAMDFDHTGLRIKNFNISDFVIRGFSKQRIEEEIKQCDIVCSNCHRIRTFKRKQGTLE